MMNLREIFDLAVKMGMNAGPKAEKDYDEELKEMKEKYGKMEEQEKKFFDKEFLTNPFSDSRILFGDEKKKIKKVLVSIDVETSELLLVQELNRQGAKIDAVIGHHPCGRAQAKLDSMLELQEDIMVNAGVPINVIEKILAPRIREVERLLAPSNKQRTVDAARLLDIPFMCVHTAADNLVDTFLTNYFKNKKLKYVKDVINALQKIPEYAKASKEGDGPKIFAGEKNSKAGRIAITGMTGGTEGAGEIYHELTKAGVGTIVDMHISEDRRKKAEDSYLNVIAAGHMASDSVGINIFIDALEKKGIEIVPAGGLIRIRR